MSKFFTTEISDPRFEFDGLRFITVKSIALQKRADITVFVPQQTAIKGVVILLHGVYGSHWAWALKGGVHKTTQQLIQEGEIEPMILVMPSDGLFGDGSGYLPHQTADYERWIVEDVISVVQEQIEGISEALPIFIAGLSMGGYGAMRLGAKYPDVFTSFAGHSSITAFAQMAMFLEEKEVNILQKSVLSEDSILQWMLANKNRLPHFRFDCGTDDILIDFNRKLHQDLVSNGIPHSYEEHAGAHEWTYWQAHIKDTLLFFNAFLE